MIHDPEQVLKNKDISVQAISFRLVLSTFVIECSWKSSNEKPKHIFILFEKCEFVKTSWDGEQGPFRLILETNSESSDLKLELSSDDGSFCVVFGEWFSFEDQKELTKVLKNCRISEEMF